MLSRLGFQSDMMALSLVVWLCSLPLVAIFILPFFGLPAAISVSVGLLIFALIACWGICWWPSQ
jgi:hypothetical protein